MELRTYGTPTCSKCRALSELLRARGVEHEEVDVVRAGLTEDEVAGLLARLGVGPREVLRTAAPVAKELGLPGERSDAELVGLIAAHPQLLQRPIAVLGDRAVVARPAERALDLLG